MKRAYRDGTTHAISEPLDFLSRLAALVPKPKVNLTRIHGVFAPSHRPRAQIFPGKAEGECPHPDSAGLGGAGTRSARLGWAQRVRRVFGIDVEHCDRCGGSMRIIASIDNPVVIDKVLRHVQEKGEHLAALQARGPPPLIHPDPMQP